MIVYRRDEGAARGALNESERLFRKTGDKRMIATHLNVLGYITANAGDLDAARGLFEEALAIGNELNDMDLQIKESVNLAHLARLQGDTGRAAELYEQALAQARELGLKEVVVGSLSGLGHSRLAQSDFDTAGRSCARDFCLPRDRKAGQCCDGLVWIGSNCRGAWAPTRAARVLGAIDAALTAATIRYDADDKAALDNDVAAVRAAMTPEEFEENFTAGHALTLEQAIQELQSLEPATGDAQSVAPATPTLRLCALGPIRVQWGGQTLTTWSYAKVKELLFYLISHPARTKAQSAWRCGPMLRLSNCATV